MSLFTDLKEVLTPYAQKIKGFAAADEQIKADLGDKVSTVNGMPPDANGNVQINEASSVSSAVRIAIYNLLSNGVYDEDVSDDLSTVQAWTQEATELTLSQSSIEITGNGTVQLAATTAPSGLSVGWSSSNPSVATVSNSGLVTANDNGSCIITATCGDLHATCSVTVTGAIATYSITYDLTGVTSSNAAATITTGASYSTTLTPTTAENMTVIVTMQGIDITSQAYSNGVINIGAATGDIVITAYETGLYPLESGIYTFATTGERFEVSRGNHVKVVMSNDITKPADGSFVNLSDLTKNGASSGKNQNGGAVNNLNTALFSIPSGASIDASIVNTTKTFSEVTLTQFVLAMRIKNQATSLLGNFGYKENTIKSLSGTVSTATDVSCLFVYMSNPKKDVTFEFDISLTVNGDRWI